MFDREPDHVATPWEACAEFARNYGMDHPEQAWVLSDWDTWHANPFYTGPHVRHPEDDCDEEAAEFIPSPLAVDDEIPF